MRFKTHGNKADHTLVTIKNADTVTMKKGSPIFADPAQTGLECVSAESLADTKQAFFFGLIAAETQSGDPGEAVVFGFYEDARILLRTRSATDADWASVEAHSVNEALDFVTTPGVQALIKMGTIGPIANVLPALVLAESLASIASLAGTDFSGTVTVSTTNLRAMVRAM